MFDTLKLDHMEIWNILLEKFVNNRITRKYNVQGGGGGGGRKKNLYSQ